MTTTTLTEGLAAMKNVKVTEIKNLDTYAGTFELGKGVYSFDMTASGKYIKTGSVKFLNTITNFQNCTA